MLPRYVYRVPGLGAVKVSLGLGAVKISLYNYKGVLVC